jgi:hypothetical protein
MIPDYICYIRDHRFLPGPFGLANPVVAGAGHFVGAVEACNALRLSSARRCASVRSEGSEVSSLRVASGAPESASRFFAELASMSALDEYNMRDLTGEPDGQR